MAKYIDRDALLEHLKKDPLFDLVERYGVSGVIESFPAADVRPVVLCRDCKWCHAGYCEKYDDLIPFGCANKPWEDWFCADGQR